MMKFFRELMKDVARDVLDEGKFTIEHEGMEFIVRPVGKEVSIPHTDGPDMTFHVESKKDGKEK